MLKITIITFSKKLAQHEQNWIDVYQKRLQHYCKFEILRFAEDYSLSKVFKKEVPNSLIYAMDEKGKESSSVQLAHNLEKQTHKHLFYIIGGSYGLPQDINDYSHIKISLSKMTLPHRMALLILSEQLYRAFSINNNSPYHHE